MASGTGFPQARGNQLVAQRLIPTFARGEGDMGEEHGLTCRKERCDLVPAVHRSLSRWRRNRGCVTRSRWDRSSDLSAGGVSRGRKPGRYSAAAAAAASLLYRDDRPSCVIGELAGWVLGPGVGECWI